MDFRIIKSFSNDRKFYLLMPEKSYNVPPRATHIRIHNGFIAFGISKDESSLALKIKKTKRGRFIKIPPGVTCVQFPEYFLTKHGHKYGPIVFNPPHEEPLNAV